MSALVRRAREVLSGFNGRFFFDEERGDLAYIAKACDDRQCSCEEKLNADGDQDCSICIGDMNHGADTGEPIAKALNLVPALAARVEELERLLAEACEIADWFAGNLSGLGATSRFQRLSTIRSAIAGEEG